MIKLHTSRFFTLALLMTTAFHSKACDICGCGNGGSFLGIMPQAHRGFVGLRYGQQSYLSHLNSQNLKSQESFQKVEVWSRVFPLKKVQVLAFVPYFFNEQTLLKNHKKSTLQGLGDISAVVSYNLFNTMTDTLPRVFDHNLVLGGGVKLPTGKYQYDLYSDDQVANPNFQLGTGSFDFILNAIYRLRYRNWGLNYDITYKINTTNANQYRFGNRLNTNLSLLYFKSFSELTLMPNMGLSYELNQRDFKDSYVNTNTGGYLSFGSLGLEAYFQRLNLGLNYQIPLLQNLVDGQLQANTRTSVHCTIMF